MNRIPFTVTPTSISLVLDKRHRQLNSSHVNFVIVRKTLINLDHARVAGDVETYNSLIDSLRTFVDVPSFIALVTEGRVQVGDKEVRFDGKPVTGHIADRLIQLLSEGFDVRPLARMLERLEKAPISDAKDGFLRWLEKSNMPLCEDGCFTAYKFVAANYLDNHTNTIFNGVGAVIPRLPVDEINTDREQTCAASGYHFCSWEYTDLSGYPHVMIVKIAPEDVASFPASEEAKGRCLFYEIVDEVPKSELGKREIENSPMYGVDAPVQNWDNDEGRTFDADKDEGDEEDGDEHEDEEADGDTVVDEATFETNYSPAPPVRALHDLQRQEEKAARKAFVERSVSAREKWLARLAKTKVGGKKLTEARIKQMVDKHGQREVSRRTGIPRSTLQGNVK